MILQLRHATFITQSLKEIHSGRETGLIDTGPLLLALQVLMKSKARSIALASAVKIDESLGIRCILLWLSDI